MSHFEVQSVKFLDEFKEGDVLQESDFAAMTPSGRFVQLKYIEDKEEIHPYICKPGVWSIQKTTAGFILEATSFVKDHILDSFVYTKLITDKIDCFFNNLDVYREHGIDVPSRKMLLYGVAGSGKTTSAIKAANTYVADGRTAAIVWSTDTYEASEVKEFFKSFEYKDVDKVILIMEDIGGVEIDQVRMKSTSSLLSLLDNQEKTFKIPIFIIGTTNHPENFLGNLTNRPGRFDDKVNVPYPPAESRVQLLKFFNKRELDETILEYFSDKKFNEFSPAHIKEAVIRSAIYKIPLRQAIDLILSEINHFKNAFSDKKKLGIINEDYD